MCTGQLIGNVTENNSFGLYSNSQEEEERVKKKWQHFFFHSIFHCCMFFMSYNLYFVAFRRAGQGRIKLVSQCTGL